MTSQDALASKGRIARSGRVLIDAVSSGVGTAAVQVAHAIGAGKVIGVSR